MSLVLRLVIFLSVLASLSSTATSKATCNNDQLVSALQPLRANVNYSTCQVDASAAAICVSSACKSLMAPLVALDLPVCQLSLRGIAFNTFALRSIASASCSQSTKQSQSTSAADMLRTILRLMN